MQGLKLAHDNLIGASFEEVLREADVAESLGHDAAAAARADKVSECVLLERPHAFNLAIGWDSPQVGFTALLPAISVH